MSAPKILKHNNSAYRSWKIAFKSAQNLLINKKEVAEAQRASSKKENNETGHGQEQQEEEEDEGQTERINRAVK